MVLENLLPCKATILQENGVKFNLECQEYIFPDSNIKASIYGAAIMLVF